MRRAGWPLPARALELVGANWMGVLFLLFVTLLTADVATGFGFLFRRFAPAIRGWAVVGGAALAALALVQGLRPPVVREFDVHLQGLPSDRDGTVIVFISDLHLGTLVGERWLMARVAQMTDAIVRRKG